MKVQIPLLILFYNSVLSCESPWFSVDGWHYRVSSEAIPYWKVDSYCGSLAEGSSVASIFSESDYWTIKFYLDLYGYGSVWISDEYRPEYWTKNWRNIYAVGEPDFSGNCLYLSASRNFQWRDTSCARKKFALCQIDECNSVSNQQGCQTVNQVPCQFPFEYQGKMYKECTSKGDINDRPWCSTSTDQEHKHRSGSSTWGYCDPELC